MKIVLLMLSAMFFVLAGCNDASGQVENQIETLDESTLQQDLQTLIEYESQLQEDFEDSLDGEDLSNFNDGTAQVFSNIESRSTTLDALTEEVSTYEEVSSELQDVSFPEEESDLADVVDSMTDTIDTIISTMTSFLPQYEEVLNHESEYFNSLGEEGADFDIFSSGLEELNERHDEIDDFYHTLDDAITSLNENKSQAETMTGEEGESS